MITNLANGYIGDSSISRLYQGDQLLFVSGNPDIRLDWIANGADDASANPDVYFDTGFVPQLSTAAEFKCETPVLAVARVFGCGNSATASSMYNFNLYAHGPTPDGTNKTSLKFFYRGGAVSAPFTPVVNTPYTVSLWGTNSGNTASDILMTVNGTMYQRSITVTTNITDAQSAYIFRWHGNENDIPSGVKFYYVKIWQNNNLVHFYVPVLHYINGQYTPCFYDKVNNNYIYNLGTDSPTYKISEDYLLDNIKRTGGGLTYDTGVDVARGLAICTRFSAGSSVASGNTNEGIIVGVRDDNANKYGIYAPYSGISGSTTANWYLGLKGLGYNLNTTSACSFDTNYRVSTSPTISSKILYVGSNGYNSTTGESSTAGIIGSRIKVFGDSLQRAWPNTLVNYCIITSTVGIGRKPLCSFVPVYHNGVPCFYDVEKGTYTYNTDTGTPGYEFQK